MKIFNINIIFPKSYRQNRFPCFINVLKYIYEEDLIGEMAQSLNKIFN